jgi:hypothetical protein
MKNIKEKQMLVTMARMMGQAPDPAVVKELEIYNRLQESVRSSVRENFFADFGEQFQRVTQIEETKAAYPKPPSLDEMGFILDDAIALVEEIRPMARPDFDYPKPPSLEDLEKAVTEEIKAEPQEELTEENIDEISSLVDRTKDFIAKEAERTGQTAMSDAERSMADIQIDALQKKIKYLEGWLTRITNTGPGSGETRILRMDDVNPNDKANGKVLVWDSSQQKLIFGDVNSISGTTTAIRYLFYPTAGQTILSGNDHYGDELDITNPDFVSLFMNGVKLIKNVDYVPHQTYVQLSEGAAAGSVIEIVTLDVPQVAVEDTVHVVTGANNYYEVLITDAYIGVASTPNTTVTVVLPEVQAGRKVTVKDEGGAAAVNHITVQAASGLVENDSNVIMTANNISLQFFYNGTGWFIV